jgi:1-acyl-sn-glycerol-3-phosphate acyltransferase
VAALTPLVVEEILRAVKKLNRSGRMAALLRRLLTPAARRFTRILVEFDTSSKYLGADGASRRVFPLFFTQMAVRGADNIPRSGPLILAANHPGGMDFIAIAGHAGRDDLKIISSEVDFLQRLPEARRYLIDLPDDARARFAALKEALAHLQQGGMLLLFPTGSIDPDPHYFSNPVEHIGRWSQSLEVFLRKVPGLQVVPVISSQAIGEVFLFRNPLVQAQKTRVDRQRLAEFLQVMLMVFLHGPRFRLKVSIGKSLRAEGGSPADAAAFYAALKASAEALLADHLAAFPPARQVLWTEKPKRFRS